MASESAKKRNVSDKSFRCEWGQLSEELLYWACMYI